MQEHLPGKAFNEMTLVYAGDARNNMGNSMLEAAALTGLDLRLVAPQACWPEAALVTECRALAQQNGGNITLTEDVAKELKVLTLSIPMYGCRWGKQKRNGQNGLHYCVIIR